MGDYQRRSLLLLLLLVSLLWLSFLLLLLVLADVVALLSGGDLLQAMGQLRIRACISLLLCLLWTSLSLVLDGSANEAGRVH